MINNVPDLQSIQLLYNKKNDTSVRRGHVQIFQKLTTTIK